MRKNFLLCLIAILFLTCSCTSSFSGEHVREYDDEDYGAAFNISYDLVGEYNLINPFSPNGSWTFIPADAYSSLPKNGSIIFDKSNDETLIYSFTYPLKQIVYYPDSYVSNMVFEEGVKVDENEYKKYRICDPIQDMSTQGDPNKMYVYRVYEKYLVTIDDYEEVWV